MRGEGRVYQRGARWWLEYWHRGRQFRECGGDTEDAARTKLLDRFAERRRHEFKGLAAERITVGELLADYEEHLKEQGKDKSPSTKYHVARLRMLFGSDRAIDISEERLKRFVKEERASGTKGKRTVATVNRALQVLRAAFRLAQPRLKYVPVFHLASEKGNIRRGFFEVEEYETLITQLPSHYADVVRFAFHTGWRKGEIVGLTWDRVDRSAGEIRLDDSKNGDGRVLGLDEELARLIEERWQQREVRNRKTGAVSISHLVFHRNGKPIGDFRKEWQKACTAAGCPTRLFHDLRRSGVRNMVRAGVYPGIARSISGHKTDHVFERYNIKTTDDHRDALRAVQQHLEQRRQQSNVVSLPTKKTA